MQGFENVNQQNEFWECLKERYIPLKFAYVGDAALTHDRLAKQASYNNAIHNNDKRYENLEKVLPSKNLSTLLEIGSGNGENTSQLIASLQKRLFAIKRVICCDYSETLLHMAGNHIRNEHRNIDLQCIQIDLEKGENTLEISTQAPMLVTMLGNTIGNMRNPEVALVNVAKIFANRESLFLMEIALRKEGASGLEYLLDYKNEVFSTAALEPLKMGGINVDKGSFSVWFDDKMSAILGKFTFQYPEVVYYRNEAISFRAGDEIVCFLSRRFTLREVRALLSKTGWHDLHIDCDHSSSHAQIYASL